MIVYEFGRAALARHRQTGENLLAALNRLVSRNHRRYGGALIHLSIVLMALGIIGIEMFQTQTQGSIPLGKTLKLGNYEIMYTDLISTFSSTNEKTTATINVFKMPVPPGSFIPAGRSTSIPGSQ